jgi:hypothetical protein
MVLSVVNLHRLRVDEGLERVEGVGQRRKGEGHGRFLLAECVKISYSANA